jgi:methionine synthase I (cobalamin-dependent)
MMTFLAAYAYGHGEIPVNTPVVMRSTNPIDLGVFRSRGLYPVLLTLAIAHQRDWLVTKEPDKLAEIVERFAAAGANLVGASAATPFALSTRLLDDLTTPLETRPQATITI